MRVNQQNLKERIERARSGFNRQKQKETTLEFLRLKEAEFGELEFEIASFSGMTYQLNGVSVIGDGYEAYAIAKDNGLKIKEKQWTF